MWLARPLSLRCLGQHGFDDLAGCCRQICRARGVSACRAAKLLSRGRQEKIQKLKQDCKDESKTEKAPAGDTWYRKCIGQNWPSDVDTKYLYDGDRRGAW
jgi:hypothetical protein